jgi:Lipocalin-like domain
LPGTLAAMMVTSSLAQENSGDDSWVRNKIVGTWKLVLAEDTLRDGSSRAIYGLNGQGFLMYSVDGFMCAVLMDPDRPKWANPKNPTQADKASAFDGSYGYCGRYEIDAKHNALVHLPEVSTGPNYVATRQVRPYRFEGNRMIFSDTMEDESDVVSWKIVWEKVS